MVEFLKNVYGIAGKTDKLSLNSLLLLLFFLLSSRSKGRCEGNILGTQDNLYEDKSQHAKDERTSGKTIWTPDCIAEQSLSIPTYAGCINKTH